MQCRGQAALVGAQRQANCPDRAPMALLPVSMMLGMLEGSPYCCIMNQVRLHTEGHRRLVTCLGGAHTWWQLRECQSSSCRGAGRM